MYPGFEQEGRELQKTTEKERLSRELWDLLDELDVGCTDDYHGFPLLDNSAIAERIIGNGWTKPVHCCNCGFFMEYTEEQKQKTTCKGAVGDCYIRRMHSDDEQFYARKAKDYCSDGKVREDA